MVSNDRIDNLKQQADEIRRLPQIINQRVENLKKNAADVAQQASHFVAENGRHTLFESKFSSRLD